MLSQIAYVRQQIHHAQRASTPSTRDDHLQRALDGLERVEWQAKDLAAEVLIGAGIVDDIPDPFLPVTEDDVKRMDTDAIAEMIERAR